MARATSSRASGRRRAHFYYVELNRGRSHDHWKSWWEFVDGDLGGADIDFTGHAKIKIVKSYFDLRDFRLQMRAATDHEIDEDDITVEEITKASVQGQHAAFLETIQRYYRAFRNI